jgi:hypothetical protein
MDVVALTSSAHMVVQLTLFIFLPPLQIGGAQWNVQIYKDNIQRFFIAGSHYSLDTFRGIVGLLAPFFFTL